MKRDLFRDLAKAMLLGLILAAACFALVFLLGLVFGQSDVLSGLEAAKDALCLLAAAFMLLLAGALLQKGKRPAAFPAEKNGWRRRFRVVGPKTVLLCLAVGCVVLAALADALLRRA